MKIVYSGFVCAILLASVSGCTDDGAAAQVQPTQDSGLDASPAASATQSAADAHAADAWDPNTDSGSGTCGSIASACVDFEDADGLGNLCLRVSADADNEQCDALSDECLAYCQPNTPAVPDAGTVSAEECDEMGDRCHDLDKGHGLGKLCHETGHTGNPVWCTAIFDECTALCGHLESEPEADASDAAARDAAAASDAALASDAGVR